MIGIVLWSDTTAGKAVIWCEDQGELAFYSHVGTTENFAIRVGDWVSFDLKLKSDLRVALDIQVLREPGCPHLAENLAVADKKAGAASSLKLVAIGTASRDPSVNVTAAMCAPVAERPGTSSRLGQPGAARGKVKEGLSKSGRFGSLPAEDRAQNIIAFPMDAAGRLRRA
ncbi:hypothetical protein ACFP4H_12055 [Pseudophaeobacter arcticus]|uniref:hypothetical protein n=1 Tax=Pseudophaeobacter arcticus TaxID=385492 RepID=UPI000405150C|nr:hypothetical protein [Pseudophaeobacter arcticus]